MIMTLDLTWISTLVPFLLIGGGLGYLWHLGIDDDKEKQLERMKHNLSVKKEWIRMVADQKTNKSKWPADWS
jgi:hypothetical protein